ncbi:MAG: exported protein of unknown function [Solirubrobacterales bacterium]|nr:exported protein of unknown function [Solirubrobacterales bacterium]
MGRRRRPRLALSLFGALMAFLIALPAAQASFHLMKIREVYPAGDASYVELQMFSAGEYLVAGHHLVAYNADGSVANDFSLPSNVSAASPNNATVLIADSGYAGAFPSGPAADEADPNLNLAAAGGAVCWTDGSPPDCVAWGSFTGPLPTHVPPLVVGSPASPAGVIAGRALRRSIAPACATFLEEGDDSDSSAADFSEVSPQPRANASPITETPCVLPTAAIDSKPANPTKSTSASFTFHSSPAGASFECKLDLEAFATCASGISYAGPLGDATHSFQVRAKDTSGTGAATSYSWRVDTTAPGAVIDSHPIDPSPGKSAAFTFHADEAGSSFECGLDKGVEIGGFSSCSSGKTYSSLADGAYTFNVRAKDQATNLGAASSFSWEVDNSLADTTPPQTTIASRPPDPSTSANVFFSYDSNEAGSSFECALDGAGFSACAPSGISYAGLANGPHAFQVRAIDPSANVDPTPAGYSFSVAVPAALPLPTPPALLVKPAVAPQTVLSGKPAAKTSDRTPTFRFRSDSAGASFECAVDKASFKPCRSPFTTRSLKPGRHTFSVRAMAGGIADQSPGKFGFKVVSGN